MISIQNAPGSKILKANLEKVKMHNFFTAKTGNFSLQWESQQINTRKDSSDIEIQKQKRRTVLPFVDLNQQLSYYLADALNRPRDS